MDDSGFFSSPALSGMPEGAERAAPDSEHPFETREDVRYATSSVLGTGGMGRVSCVRDQRLLRDVALKEVAPQTRANPNEARARLAQEAWICAQLEHPSIVAVYDAGTTEAGEPFYTMQLVRGRSLEAAIEAAPDLEQRMGLLRHFLDVCEAMAYAHSLGIIHRDLKPANVMVGEFGETQVVDWGLARSLTAKDVASVDLVPDQHAAQTQFGAVLGTPHYMSPEQAAGEPADTRSDVWSLGAILRQLLTGRPAFQGSAAEVLIQLKTHGVEPLSAQASEIPADLAAIVDHALHRNVTQRYPTARELAEDVAGYLDGRRVGAYDYSPTELLRRFVQAWRIPLTVALIALLVVVGVITLATSRVFDERNRAVEAQQATRGALDTADRHLGSALVQQAAAAAERGARPEAEVLAAHALSLQESALGRGVLASFTTGARPQRLSRMSLPPCGVGSRLSRNGADLLCVASERVSLWDVSGDVPMERWGVVMRGHAGCVLDQHVVVGDRAAGDAALLSRKNGKLVARLPGIVTSRTTPAESHVIVADGQPLVWSLAQQRLFEPAFCGTLAMTAALTANDEQMALICGSGRIGQAKPSETFVSVGEPHAELSGARAAAYSPDGALLAAGGPQGVVALVQLDENTLRWSRRLPGGAFREARFSPDGAIIAYTRDRGGVLLVSAASGAVLVTLPAGYAAEVRFAQNGEVVTKGDLGLARWRLPDALPPSFVAPEYEHGLTSTAISPDGSVALLARSHGHLEIRDTTNGALKADVNWQIGVIKRAAFSPDGAFAVACGIDSPGAVVLDTRDWSIIGRLIHTQLRRVVVLEDGVVIGLSYGSGPVFWRWPTHREVTIAEPALPAMGDLTAVGPRAAVVTVTSQNALYRVDSATWPPRVSPLGEALSVQAVAGSDKHDLLLVLTKTGIRVLNAQAAPIRTIEHHGADLLGIALSPNGRLAGVGDAAGNIHIWRLADGHELARLKGHTQRAPHVVFDASGDWMLSSSWDGSVRRWTMSDLEHPAKLLNATVRSAWGLDLDDVL